MEHAAQRDLHRAEIQKVVYQIRLDHCLAQYGVSFPFQHIFLDRWNWPLIDLGNNLQAGPARVQIRVISFRMSWQLKPITWLLIRWPSGIRRSTAPTVTGLGARITWCCPLRAIAPSGNNSNAGTVSFHIPSSK